MGFAASQVVVGGGVAEAVAGVGPVGVELGLGEVLVDLAQLGAVDDKRPEIPLIALDRSGELLSAADAELCRAGTPVLLVVGSEQGISRLALERATNPFLRCREPAVLDSLRLQLYFGAVVPAQLLCVPAEIEALSTAEADDEIRAIVLRGAGEAGMVQSASLVMPHVAPPEGATLPSTAPCHASSITSAHVPRAKPFSRPFPT